MQNGKRTAFGMLEDCQRMAAAAGSGSDSSRLLLGLQEPVMGLQSLGEGAGVEVTTQKRRYRSNEVHCMLSTVQPACSAACALLIAAATCL
jgi:hypothetical protein